MDLYLIFCLIQKFQKMTLTISSSFFILRCVFTNYLILSDNSILSNINTSFFIGLLVDHLYDGVLMYISNKSQKIKRCDGLLVFFKILLYIHAMIFCFHFEKHVFIFGSLTSLVGSFIFVLEQEVGITDTLNNVNNVNNVYHQLKSCTINDIKYHKECCICLDMFREEEDLKKLSCAHVFHSNCLSKYLEVSMNINCPVCRKSL